MEVHEHHINLCCEIDPSGSPRSIMLTEWVANFEGLLECQQKLLRCLITGYNLTNSACSVWLRPVYSSCRGRIFHLSGHAHDGNHCIRRIGSHVRTVSRTRRRSYFSADSANIARHVNWIFPLRLWLLLIIIVDQSILVGFVYDGVGRYLHCAARSSSTALVTSYATASRPIFALRPGGLSFSSSVYTRGAPTTVIWGSAIYSSSTPIAYTQDSAKISYRGNNDCMAECFSSVALHV